MTDLWINLLLAMLVTLATVIADWVVKFLVISRRRLASISRVVDQAISERDKIDEIKKEVDRFKTAQTATLIWGSDLASIAFSLDLAILGVWITNPQFFPFFSRWNSLNTPREIPVWLILLFAHFLVLLLSIVLKHYHGDTIETNPPADLAKLFRLKWFAQNKFMLTSNVIGFLSLFSSFAIIKNSF